MTLPSTPSTPSAPLPAATILGYPRIGPDRELKRDVESYWKGALDASGLRERAAALRAATRARQIGRASCRERV